MSNINSVIEENCARLRKSYYTGRTIIMGLSPSADKVIQLYWTVGRSKNSKNRCLIRESGEVRTYPITEDKNMKFPELLIYNISQTYKNKYIITNGTQTDDICKCFEDNRSFEEAINEMLFEHDDPIYTPRISGVVDLENNATTLNFGIVRTSNRNPEMIIRQTSSLKKTIPGVGYCIHTYNFDDQCMPFEGEPYPVKLFDNIDELIGYYWNLIPTDKRVGLYCRFIDLKNGDIEDRVVNER